MNEKKYEITNIAHPHYPWLHRIRALRDVREDVHAGDLGDFVQSEENLSQEGQCWIAGNAVVAEEAYVYGDAILWDHACARGCAAISGLSRIGGNAIIEDYPELKVVLTLGENGSIFVNANQELRQASFKVDVVDTTAAGDTFLGYFVAELSKGTDYSQILKIASVASAITVSRKGAAPSIPNKSEVLSLFDKLRESKSNNKNNSLYEQIEGYIEQNIKTANLSELSQILGYSTVYTGSIVKRLTGETFSKTVLLKRCKMAAYMLLSTNFSIHEIINMVGYENESFFRKAFKNKYGETLSEYRNKRSN